MGGKIGGCSGRKFVTVHAFHLKAVMGVKLKKEKENKPGLMWLCGGGVNAERFLARPAPCVSKVRLRARYTASQHAFIHKLENKQINALAKSMVLGKEKKICQYLSTN